MTCGTITTVVIRLFSFMFTYYSISALINFLFSLLASLFLIVSDKKKIEKKVINSFFRFSFFVIFWSGYYFLWQISTSYAEAILYSKLLIFFAAFIPIAYLDYVICFLGYNTKKTKIFIIAGYIVFFLFALKGLVLGVTPKLIFEFWPTGTQIFPLFLFLWSLVFSVSFLYFVFSLAKKNKKIEKKYIFLSMFGFILGFFGGATNYFLWFDIPIKPFGNILVSVYFFITLYTVRRYNVSNLRLFYIQLPALVISMFAFGRILISEGTFDLYTNVLFFFVVAIASVYIIRSSEQQEKNQVMLQDALKKVGIANEKLIEIDKHKNDFVSIAAHQLRTPAGVIKNYASMLKQGLYGEINEKTHEPIDRIYENGVLLASTVSSLLDISRIESGKQKIDFVPVVLSEIIKNTVQELDNIAKKKNLTLTLQIKEGGDYGAVLDKEKTEHMFNNLIENSIKYTDAGSVTVKVYPANGSSVCVDVSDTGRGMSSEFINTQLYQKFAREEVVTKNINGNGLGMYYVKEVVDLHKGKIDVVSEVGKGTTFTVTLPKGLKVKSVEE